MGGSGPFLFASFWELWQDKLSTHRINCQTLSSLQDDILGFKSRKIHFNWILSSPGHAGSLGLREHP